MLRRYVIRALGADPSVGDLLVDRVRARYGASFVPRAVLFVLATARPVAVLVPRKIRFRLILRFVEPLIDSAPAGLAYVTGSEAHLTEPCEGMLEP